MKKYIACILLLTFLSVKVYGHTPIGGLAWTTIGAFGLYDSRNEKILPSFELNSSFVFINGGLSYKNITYVDSKKLFGYVGLGLGSAVQLQAGFAKGNFSLRGRSDIQMGYIFEDFAEKHPYFGLITISASIEKYFNNSQKNWYFGIGIGFSINYIDGFNVF